MGLGLEMGSGWVQAEVINPIRANLSKLGTVKSVRIRVRVRVRVGVRVRIKG